MSKLKKIMSRNEITNSKFTLGSLTIEREPDFPYFWLVKKDGKIIDRDQYSNDIEERFEMGQYD